MKKRILFLMAMIPLLTQAQLFYNNGATVQLNPGAIVQVNGNAQNQTGIINVATASAANLYITGSLTNNATINGYGNIHLNGDWINNSVFNCFTGLVSLEGAAQNLSGSVSTTFFNLTLLGTGIKTQTINQTTSGVLNLNDRELATNVYTMFVTNPAINAVQRTTGMVSSNNGGFLSRNTNLAGAYLFPVGSSTGTTRYRPVELTPASTSANTYVVRMANLDATSEGYNRSLKEASICLVNPLFYHQINRSAGSDAVDLSIYFDQTTDGVWDSLGNWHTAPTSEWYNINGSVVISGSPLSHASVTGWNDFSQLPYGLTRGIPVIDLGNDTTICSNSSITLDAGSGFTSYAWNTGSTSQTISVNTGSSYSVTVTDGTCTASDIINITVVAVPLVDLGADTTICQGESLVLDAGTSGNGYLWSNMAVSQTITVSTSALYSVTVTNGGICPATDQILVSVLPWADATITSPLAYCSGDAALNLSANDPGGVWNGSGIINTTNGTFDPGLAGAGNHEIIYTIAGNCGDADTVTINITQSANASISPAGPFCILDAAVDLNAADAGGSWSGNGITNSANGTFNPASAGVGTHTITYGISGVCGDTATTPIIVIDVADATISAAGPFCDNEAALNLTAVDPAGSWSGVGITNASTGTFNPSTAGEGNHSIVYSIPGSCGDADTINITVFETPAVTVFSTNETCIGLNDGMAWVDVSGGTQPYSILWSNSETTDSIFALVPGTFSVTVNDANGCGWIRQVDVEASNDLCYTPHIWAPNIFSPNGDGNNDVAFVRGDGVQYVTFIIYDRWGEKIFESNSLSVGWDGTYKGKALDPAVFVYYVKATFVDNSQSELHGNITLVR
ncbi:MAG: gliding motility-associated C-terminal domain-containing protein [Bacteroidales bacterium]|jgi:gliding motility-associated-like protein|nr:gliding motility-associated C-terminal domain-containing protein [Bacteroidales bacterium]